MPFTDNLLVSYTMPGVLWTLCFLIENLILQIRGNLNIQNEAIKILEYIVLCFLVIT